MVRTVKSEGIVPLFEHAIRAIQGGRNYQEDAAVVWPGGAPLGPSACDLPENALPESAGQQIAVLADGMGGHAAGALAAQTICEHFVESYVAGAGPATERLQAALFASNGAIGDKVDEDSDLAGMGATAVGLSLGTWDGQLGAHWISVGDSPLFLYRAGELVQLNEDHSMAPVLDKMAARGEIRERDALTDGRRHFLRSAVSGGEIELIDRSVMPLPLEEDDYLVIASDGLQTLNDAAIARTIAAHETKGSDAVARALIAAVEAAAIPHQDNTTVIVLRATPQGEPA